MRFVKKDDKQDNHCHTVWKLSLTEAFFEILFVVEGMSTTGLRLSEKETTKIIVNYNLINAVWVLVLSMKVEQIK